MPTLKQRVSQARKSLGHSKADEILRALEEKLGHSPTLKQTADALSAAAPPTSRPAPIAPAGSWVHPTSAPVALACQLVARYDALANDEARRAFYRANENLLAKSKIPGLVLVCMAAAKPLSARARLQLAIATEADLIFTPSQLRQLSAYERGLFQVKNGKVAAPTMKRSVFQEMSPRDRAEFIREGGKLID
jgi:hypothetical protein